ncbi:MAG: VTT domain-containing protein, partial [Acidobacteria bacterium]|nr:VTT domain-containing protein [Acidobacteriota bacterium]
MELFHFLTDVEALVRWGGYLGLSLIVFTETGLMVGFFLPGDSLLVTAGLFAAQGHLDIVVLNLLLISMAIAGDATGYLIGRVLGPRVFERPSSRLFRREHLIRTRLYYEMHGGKTIIIARFIPVLRTFAPVVAGIAGMDVGEIRDLSRAARVHDVGRVAISPEIWEKTTPLSRDEYEQVRLHPYHTERIL